MESVYHGDNTRQGLVFAINWEEQGGMKDEGGAMREEGRGKVCGQRLYPAACGREELLPPPVFT